MEDRYRASYCSCSFRGLAPYGQWTFVILVIEKGFVLVIQIVATGDNININDPKLVIILLNIQLGKSGQLTRNPLGEVEPVW